MTDKIKLLLVLFQTLSDYSFNTSLINTFTWYIIKESSLIAAKQNTSKSLINSIPIINKCLIYQIHSLKEYFSLHEKILFFVLVDELIVFNLSPFQTDQSSISILLNTEKKKNSLLTQAIFHRSRNHIFYSIIVLIYLFY